MADPRYFLLVAANGHTTLGLYQHYGDQLVEHSRTNFLPVDRFALVDKRARNAVKREFLRNADIQNPTFAPLKLAPMHLEPGQYYPRMARPDDSHPFASPGRCPDPEVFDKELIEAAAQVAYLVARLEGVFQVVQPAAKTRLAYGHEIRNVLVAASMEVEAQCKAVLLANGARHLDNMSHYAALASAMRLPEYSLQFTRCPWFGVVSPFKGWSANRPMPWYSAYNEVKHNRETMFELATLENAMFAVAACAIMLLAQVGDRDRRYWRHEIAEFFVVDQAPRWKPTEVYVNYPPIYLRPYKPTSFF